MNKGMSTFECQCPKPKKQRLTFDGGSSGKYVVDLCEDCRDREDCEFLIGEEVIGN